MTISPEACVANAEMEKKMAAQQSHLRGERGARSAEQERFLVPASRFPLPASDLQFGFRSSFMLFRSPESIKKDTVHSAEEP
jgi:hypothetical protein